MFRQSENVYTGKNRNPATIAAEGFLLGGDKREEAANLLNAMGRSPEPAYYDNQVVVIG